MKKLNRKGFTLIELLAVIIILAIVVGISIPAVLTTVNGAKSKAFQTAADTFADWINREYEIQANGLSGVQTLNPSFNTHFVSSGYISSTGSVNALEYMLITSELVEAGGLKTANINTHTAVVKKTAGTTEGTVTQANITNATVTISKDRVPYSSVYINSATARSCVRLVAKSGGDYDTNTATTKFEVVCGGSCQSTTKAAGNYCKAGTVTCNVSNGTVTNCTSFT